VISPGHCFSSHPQWSIDDADLFSAFEDAGLRTPMGIVPLRIDPRGERQFFTARLPAEGQWQRHDFEVTTIGNAGSTGNLPGFQYILVTNLQGAVYLNYTTNNWTNVLVALDLNGSITKLV